MKSIEVLFTPAEFTALKDRDLRETICVVFDVLRATSTMVTALGNGAAGLVPVEQISEAIAYRARHPQVLLAGERQGVRIQADGVTFDLGNSPREFTPDAVGGRQIVMTTTNGTRALRACAHARRVLTASFLNLSATASALASCPPAPLLLVCSGTHEEAAYEDAVAAGALCDLLDRQAPDLTAADSALIARRLWQVERADPLHAISQSRNARRLLSLPELRDDVVYCLQPDRFPLVAELDANGVVRRVP